MVKRLCAVVAFAMLLCSCNKVYRYTDASFFAMNTFVSVIAENKSDIDGIEQLTGTLEGLYSRTDENSEIFAFNRDGYASLSPDTDRLLQMSLEIARNTDGAYNPCMGSVVSLWDITSGKEFVPDEEQIAQALKNTDYTSLMLEDGVAVSENKEMQIDLGGIGKGYALGKAIDKAKENGAQNVCISFGGNVGVFGSSASRKSENKTGWTVGITNPFDTSKTLGNIVLEDGFVSVSGAYERFFEKDGVVYHHIFDPATGKPSESDVASSCVVTTDAPLGDALSTALFVMGSEKAVDFYNIGKYAFDMILIKKDGEILVSAGLKNVFTLTEQGFSVKYLDKTEVLP